jgi:hypothetical protein
MRSHQSRALLVPSILRYHGDAIVDFTRKDEISTEQQVEQALEAATEKYRAALRINSRYSLGYYSLGRCLKFRAKLKRPLYLPAEVTRNRFNTGEALFEEATECFQRANATGLADPYLQFEHASTLQDYALLLDSLDRLDDAELLLARAEAMFGDAAAGLPSDAWLLRSWADSLYDRAKNRISALRIRFGSVDAAPQELLEQVRRLLSDACGRYERAVDLTANYINALNSWGLALSTLARLSTTLEEAERLFQSSYDKFARAIAIRPDESNTEICNWSMTLGSHATVRVHFALRGNTVPPNPTSTSLDSDPHLPANSSSSSLESDASGSTLASSTSSRSSTSAASLAAAAANAGPYGFKRSLPATSSSG